MTSNDPVPYTFRRYVLPTLAATASMAAFLCVRFSTVLVPSHRSTDVGLAFVMLGLVLIYALSGVAGFFMGEYYRWRRTRTLRSLD